jgi:hypothetical protein
MRRFVRRFGWLLLLSRLLLKRQQYGRLRSGGSDVCTRSGDMRACCAVCVPVCYTSSKRIE